MRRLYAALLLLVYAACIAYYWTDVSHALRWTARALGSGGPLASRAGLLVLLELAVFAATMSLVPRRPRPLRDLALLAAAGLLGWLAEAWGTRTGLWTYYNGERPPLLIFVVWSVGAVVLARAGEIVGEVLPRFLVRAAYWLAAAAFAAAFALFLGPRLAWPSSLAAAAALGCAFLLAPEPEQDGGLLAAGPLLVLLVDYVGVRSHCWTYASAGGPWSGLFFGALFDSAVVLAALRLARRLVPG